MDIIDYQDWVKVLENGHFKNNVYELIEVNF